MPGFPWRGLPRRNTSAWRKFTGMDILPISLYVSALDTALMPPFKYKTRPRALRDEE
jgi:hypothetical protein